MIKKLSYEVVRFPKGQNFGVRHHGCGANDVVNIGHHFHTVCEVMFFSDAEGKVLVGEQEYSITANTLVFFPSMSGHSVELTEGHSGCYLLQYETQLYSELELQSLNAHSAPLVVQLESEQGDWVGGLFSWCLQSYAQHNGKMIRTNILRLLLLLVDEKLQAKGGNISKPELATAKQDKSLNRLLPLLQDMDRGERLSISLDEAAQMCGISRYHFSRLFKSVFQINFKDYVLKRKISAAVTLLSTTDMSVADVAYACEFTDAAYFCSRFKQALNQSPSEFRRHSLESHGFQS